MAGMLNIIPRYLPRYGMATDWARSTRPLVVLLSGVAILVTVLFKANVGAPAGALAPGVPGGGASARHAGVGDGARAAGVGGPPCRAAWAGTRSRSAGWPEKFGSSVFLRETNWSVSKGGTSA